MWRSVVSLPKTRASRDSVPIIPALAEILGAYRRSTGNPELGFVFRSSDGLPISLDIVERRVIRPALEAIGLPWRGWHAFRRGLASNLYAMGAPDKVVQRILRHSRPHVTKERYIKVFDRTVLEAADNLQTRIEELRKTKEPCQQLELRFGDGVERPPTVLSEYPAFSRLADSSLSGSSWPAHYLEYGLKLFEIMPARFEQTSMLDAVRGNLAERGGFCCLIDSGNGCLYVEGIALAAASEVDRRLRSIPGDQDGLF
jgi:Phage integrase family